MWGLPIVLGITHILLTSNLNDLMNLFYQFNVDGEHHRGRSDILKHSTGQSSKPQTGITYHLESTCQDQLNSDL